MPDLNAMVARAKDILLYYGISPYWDRENLCYAPNGGNKTHKESEFQAVHTAIQQAFITYQGRGEIEEILRVEARRFIREGLMRL